MTIKHEQLVTAYQVYLRIMSLTESLESVNKKTFLYDDAEYMAYVLTNAPRLRERFSDNLDTIMYSICFDIADRLPEKYSLNAVENHYRVIFRDFYDHKRFNPTVDEFALYYDEDNDGFYYNDSDNTDYIDHIACIRRDTGKELVRMPLYRLRSYNNTDKEWWD